MNFYHEIMKKKIPIAMLCLFFCASRGGGDSVFAAGGNKDDVNLEHQNAQEREAGDENNGDLFGSIYNMGAAVANSRFGTALGNGLKALVDKIDERIKRATADRDEKLVQAEADYQEKQEQIRGDKLPPEEKERELARALKLRDEKIAEINEEYKESKAEYKALRTKGSDMIFKALNEGVEYPAKVETARIQAAAQAKTDQKNWAKTLEFMKDLSQDKQRLLNIALLLGGSAFLIYGAKHGIEFARNYIEAKIGKPQLVRETSRSTIFSMLFGAQQVSRMGEVVVNADVRAQLTEIAEAAKRAYSYKDELSNVLLHGPPGTGKTMFAKALAYYAGLDYAMMSGSDFSQFKEGQDIYELHKLFDWAEKSPKGLLVFVDEADAFLMSRALASTSEQSKKLTNAFLSRVEKPSSLKIMWVFATNYPHTIDKAVFSRINDKVEFVLPSQAERLDILKMYIKKYATAKKIVVTPEVEGAMDLLAQKLQGASCRDIEQCALNFVRAARSTSSNRVTLQMALKVIDRYMAEIEKQNVRGQ